MVRKKLDKALADFKKKRTESLNELMEMDLEYQRRRQNRCSSKEESKYQNEDPGQQRNQDD
jgi:hypothetical protein